MWGESLSLALPGVLVLLLLGAAVTDLRDRTIANGLNAAVALLAPVYWWASGMAVWPDMAIQLGLGVAVFVIFAGVFAIGMMGGGDVKLLGALALWLPLFAIVQMLVVMSIAGGVLTLAMLAVHRLRRSSTELEIPYGVAIAAAGLWVITERYFNQFT